MILKTVGFFPFTSLSPTRLFRILVFAREIIVHRLPLGQPPDHLIQAESSGRLKFLVSNFFPDTRELKSIISGFSDWASTYRDPKYLALLKGVQKKEDVEQSGAQLMSAIRGTRQEKKADPRQAAQIFLHFAQDLDLQRGEVDRLFESVSSKAEQLGGILGVEFDEPEDDELDPGPDLTLEHSTATLVPQRLAAWAWFFETLGPDNVPLLTDQPEVIAAMDLNLAKMGLPQKPLDAARETEVLEKVFSWDHPLTDPPSDARGSEKLDSFLADLSTQTWTLDQLAGLKDRAAGLAPPVVASGSILRLNGYLMPGTDTKTTLLQAAGIRPLSPFSGEFCGPVFELQVLKQ